MSSTNGAPAKLKETERVETASGPFPGRGPLGAGIVGQKASTFWPSTRRLLERMRPERAKAFAVLGLTVLSVAATSVGPKILGAATDVVFTGLISSRLPAGLTKAEAIARLRAQGEDQVADDGRGDGRRARAGRRLHRGRSGPDVGRRHLCGRVTAGLVVRPSRERRRAGDRPADALGRGGQGQSAAAELLRRPAAWRTAQSRDQRHRQRQHHSGADLEPASPQPADGRRRAVDDVLDLTAARTRRLGVGTDLDVRDPRRDAPLAGTLRPAVAKHRSIERTHRGDLLRTRAREGVRPTARGRAGLRRAERRAVPGVLRRSVRERRDHAGHDVPREPELRGHRGHRWPTRGQRLDVTGRRPGIHPVLPPVHPTAHAGCVHDQPAAVGRRVGRARVRASGRPGGVGRPAPTWRGPSAVRRCAEGRARSSSRTSTSPTSRTAR